MKNPPLRVFKSRSIAVLAVEIISDLIDNDGYFNYFFKGEYRRVFVGDNAELLGDWVVSCGTDRCRVMGNSEFHQKYRV